MPIAVMSPSSRNGGASEKLSDRKPMMVVTLVIVTARKLTRRLSLKAETLSSPRRIAVSIDTSRWTLSAIARVRMMVGAIAEIGSMWKPRWPARPTAVRVDRKTTARVARVAVTLRSTAIITSTSTRYISGTRVRRSF